MYLIRKNECIIQILLKMLSTTGLLNHLPISVSRYLITIHTEERCVTLVLLKCNLQLSYKMFPCHLIYFPHVNEHLNIFCAHIIYKLHNLLHHFKFKTLENLISICLHELNYNLSRKKIRLK